MFGKPPPKPEKPELPPEPDRVLTEAEEVYALRYMRLMALGLEPSEALRLVDIPDVAAQAEALHSRGCPPRLIAELLT